MYFFADWTTTVTAIRSMINNYFSRHLGNRALIIVRTGMEAGNPLQLALFYIGYKDIDSVDQARFMWKTNIDKFRRALEKILVEFDKRYH